MKTVAQALKEPGLPYRVRHLLELVPHFRRHTLEYKGIYICPESGKETVIVKGDEHFILCRHEHGDKCVESPSIFAALESMGQCGYLWKE